MRKTKHKYLHHLRRRRVMRASNLFFITDLFLIAICPECKTYFCSVVVFCTEFSCVILLLLERNLGEDKLCPRACFMKQLDGFEV